MDIATLLDQTLRNQALPVRSVRIGNQSDHATWGVELDATATSAQVQQAQDTLSAFSPTDPSVVAIGVAAVAGGTINTPIVKAILATLLDVKLNRRLTTADIPTLQAMFSQTVTYYKFIVNNGL